MQPLTAQRKATLVKQASRISVVTAVVLFMVKLSVWLLSGSVSILATLMDSLLDAFASAVTLIAVSIATKPADSDHHFGHGKAEQLAALAQSAFITGSGLFLILHAIDSIRADEPIEHSQLALIVMGFSMALTVLLLVYQNYVIRMTGSMAIKSDAMHYRVDLLANVGVVVALIVAPAGFPLADPLIGIAIAVYIIVSTGQLAWQAIQMLMDRSMDEESENVIRELALSTNAVFGIHNLRTRMSGVTPVIQFDLDLDGTLSLEQAHTIGNQVKHRILEQMPGADITIHLDPIRDSLPLCKKN